MADDPAPPLSVEDAAAILARLRPELERSDEGGPTVVLIGGQAVLFWQAFFGASEVAGEVVETSADIDFATSDRGAIRRCAELLGGRVRFADGFDPTPSLALILFEDQHGHRRQIDIVSAPLGLQLEDVRKTAQAIAAPAPGGEDLRLYILHPERLLEGRVATVAALRSDAAALAQLRSAIRSCHAYLAWLLGDEPDGARVRAVLRLYTRIFKLARSRAGRKVWAEHGIEVLDAIVPDHAALPAAFVAEDLPRKRAEVAAARERTRT